MKKLQIIVILSILLLLTACQRTTTTSTTKKVINTTMTSTLNYTSLGVINYRYSIHSEIDMIIQIPNGLEVIQILKENEIIPLEYEVDYRLLLKDIRLKKELLDSYTSVGMVKYNVFTQEGYYEIRITLIDEELPYLMNHAVMNYAPDIYVTLSFDCFGGSIVEINGYNLTHDDYYIDGNTIQIDRFYISSIYINHYEMNFLVLDYVISFNDVLYSGTFTIDFNRS